MKHSISRDAGHAFGLAENNFFAFFNASSEKRGSPCVLAQWNGKIWRFIDRFSEWADHKCALLKDGSFALPHPSHKAIVKYSGDGAVAEKLKFASDEFRECDLDTTSSGEIFVVDAPRYYFRDIDSTYVSAMLVHGLLKEFRFGSLQILRAWTVSPAGELWGCGYRSDLTPCLVNVTKGYEVVLPLERTSWIILYKMAMTNDGRFVLTIPKGQVFCGRLSDLVEGSGKLGKVGQLEPLFSPDRRDLVTIRSICEGENGDVYLGHSEGLAVLRGNKLIQESSLYPGPREIQPVNNLHPFIRFPDSLVVCRQDGVHLLKGGQDILLPPIDPDWFQRKGQSTRGVKTTKLTFEAC